MFKSKKKSKLKKNSTSGKGKGRKRGSNNDGNSTSKKARVNKDDETDEESDDDDANGKDGNGDSHDSNAKVRFGTEFVLCECVSVRYRIWFLNSVPNLFFYSVPITNILCVFILYMTRRRIPTQRPWAGWFQPDQRDALCAWTQG